MSGGHLYTVAASVAPIWARLSVATFLAAPCTEQARQAVWGVGVTRTDVHEVEDGGRTQTPYPIHTHGCPTYWSYKKSAVRDPQLADGERDATRGRGGVHRQAP